MNPSKKAIDAAIEIFLQGKDGLIGFRDGLTTAYAIDVEPLEKRVAELEEENKILRARARKSDGEDKFESMKNQGCY
jgi:hypothetical protein